MPIFEYECEDCHTNFEMIVSPNEQAVCPSCNSQHLSKQYSRFGMGSSSSGRDEPLPMYKAGGSCGCTPSNCGCKN